MTSRHPLILLAALLLLAMSLGACKNNDVSNSSTKPEIPSELLQVQERLPRLTPHVTLPAPTSLPTPEPVALTPYAPAATPTPAATTTPPLVPTPVLVLSSSQNTTIYIVQPGDTLFDIAQRMNVNLHDLAVKNGITDPTTIQTGQKLILP